MSSPFCVDDGDCASVAEAAAAAWRAGVAKRIKAARRWALILNPPVRGFSSVMIDFVRDPDPLRRALVERFLREGAFGILRRGEVDVGGCGDGNSGSSSGMR